MFKSGDYLVTTFGGEPDLWNTKPPFLIWVQVAFMKLLGVNELSIRLPSAIAVLFTCIALLLFSVRHLKSFAFGGMTILVLVTSSGYIGLHAGRTGDYDAMLSLFTTLSALCCFVYCENRKARNLYLFILFLALAVLTKSISGLLFAPAFLLYIAFTGNLGPILRNRHTYLAFLFFLVLVVGYYGVREYVHPGYLAAVRENEWGGRYLEVIEEHQGSFWYYLENLINERFTIWYLLLPCGFLSGLWLRDRRMRRLSAFSALLCLSWLLIISTAKTKLPWYDVPMYPFMAILAAFFIYSLLILLKQIELQSTFRANLLPYLFLMLVFALPYGKTFSRLNPPRETPEAARFYEIGYYLKDALKGRYDLDGKRLLYDGYRAQNLFYINILRDRGVQVGFSDWRQLEPGEVVFTQQEKIKQYLAEHYETDTLEVVGNVVTYKITTSCF